MKEIIKHGALVSGCPCPLPLSTTRTSISKLTPPFSIFQLCDIGSLPRAKSYRLTQLKCVPKPSLQIQYFTLLVGILVHLVKLRGGVCGNPSHFGFAEFNCGSSDSYNMIVFTREIT